jgi:membrane protein
MLSLLKKSFQSFLRNKDSNKAAALSFYMLFSLAPLLFLIVNMVGFFYGIKAARGELFMQLQAIVGQESAKMLQSMISHAYEPSNNMIWSIVGFIGILLTSIGIINQLRDSLIDIWNKKERKNSIFTMIKEYCISIILLLVTGVVIIVSFIISTSLAFIGKFIGDIFPTSLGQLEFFNMVSLFFILTLLCGMFFKFLPQAKTYWTESFLGAALTAFMLCVGKFAIAFYLGKSTATSAFGASGGIILVLLWIYYSSNIFFFGAEFTKQYSSTSSNYILKK